MSQIARHRPLSLLLATALIATLTVLLTQGQRADAIDGPVDIVYIATGRNFPDALAGGTLAVATNAPLLTVEKDLPLPAATVTALEALDPDRIVVFGGPAAVSDQVLGALTTHARSGEVTRIAGADRHDTAAQIAEALPDPAPVDADTLDGLDSTDFLAADGTATDSDALGGVAADEYLRIGQAAEVPVSVVRHQGCSGPAMTVGDDEDDWYVTSGYIGSLMTGTEFFCPLHLPQGATLTSLRALLRDTGPDGLAGGSRCFLRRTPLSGADAGDEVSIGSGVATLFGSSPDPILQTQGLPPTVVDNDANTYFINCDIQASGGTTAAQLGIHAAQVEYEATAVPGTNQ